MPVPNKQIRISRQDLVLGRQLARARSQGWFHWNTLHFDKETAFWHQMVSIIHNHGGYGDTERIGIIDTGFAMDSIQSNNINVDGSLDLTGEGLEDTTPHGSIVSDLIAMIAPAAEQIHVKYLNSRGLCPGLFEEQITKLKAAFDHLEKAGVTMVNLSFNVSTKLGEYDDFNPRPHFFCSCPLCRVVTEFVERTKVNVFVAEGNFLRGQREQGEWSCPGNAELVTPTIGYLDGKPIYDNNLDTTCAVSAPGYFTARRPPNLRVPLLERFRASLPSEISAKGSSFSTPYVVGTFAALKSAILRHRPSYRFEIPRNLYYEINGIISRSAPYSFPLDVFIMDPQLFKDRERPLENEWLMILEFSGLNTSAAPDLDLSSSARFHFLFGHILHLTTKFNEGSRHPIQLEYYAITFFLEGIRDLIEQKTALIPGEPFEKVKDLLEKQKAKGAHYQSLEETFGSYVEYLIQNEDRFAIVVRVAPD